MASELAERVYRKHGRSIFGVVLTKHFFDRFFERSTKMDDMTSILREVNKNLPVMIFELELSGKQKVFNVRGYRLPCILQTNETLCCPEVIVKTLYK